MFSGGRHSAPRSPNCSENWSQRKARENVQDDLRCRLLFWFPYKFRRWQDYRVCTHLRQSGFRKEIWAEVPTSPGTRHCCIDVHLLCTVVSTCIQYFLFKVFCAFTIARTVPEAFCFQALHSHVCACVIVCWKLVTMMFYKPLGNFTMFGRSEQLGTNLNWLDLSQEIKDQGYSKTKCGEICSVGVIFSPVSGISGHVLMKLITVTHYQVHMAQMTFSRSWVQRSRSRTSFSKNAVSSRGIPFDS